MVVMRGLPGFELHGIVWSAKGFTAFDAVNEETGERVLLKRWEAEHPPASVEYDPIWREQFILRQIEGTASPDGAVHRPDGSGSWGVLPWFAGTPLSPGKRDAGRPRLNALRIIESVAVLLDFVHAAGGVHGSLTPESILWSAATGVARFSDLGLAVHPALPMLNRARLLEPETARYLSPEGTGRVGAEMEYRSDFYSLGAILYQLLAGKPPFEYRDSLELAHAHLARRPVPPSAIDATTSPVLSDVVLRLLEKIPEARYRSGAGIASDIARCRQALEATGRCPPFRLGDADVPTQLRLSTKLYGRAQAQDQMLAFYQRAKQSGRGLVMVSGDPGVGKTSVVDSIRRKILEDEGFFALGKFQQSTSAQPFLGIVKAVAHLAHQLLTMPEERLSFWRARIANSLGRNVGVLTTLVSEMALVLGNEGPTIDISLDEAKTEFLLTIKRFIHLFTSRAAPLVLFLDDVQWMDEASWTLLEDLLSDPDLEHLLVITAYRTTEVADGSPLAAMLAALPDLQSISIPLGPLSRREIVSFLGDSFACREEDADSFAKLLKAKTDGNPFFLRRYLQSLANDGLIYYSVHDRCWHWDLERIEQRHISDNLVAFMLERMKNYPPETQDMLNYMACLGSALSNSDLALVCNRSSDDCARRLTQAISDGLVQRVRAPIPASGDTYAFAHDKIEQAAYALLAPSARQRRHAEIARRACERWTGPGRRIFDLVEQIDKAPDDSAAIFEPQDLARFYLQAAQRAKDNTAYVVARQYLERGIQILAGIPAVGLDALNAEMYRLGAEVEYQLGALESSRSFANLALRFIHDPLDRAGVFTLLIVQDTLRGRYQEAIDRGRYALTLLAFNLPHADFARHIDEEVRRLAVIDIEAAYEDCLALGEVNDPVISRILEILMYLIPPSYFVHPDLNKLIAALMTRLCFQNGVTAAGTKGISNFGPLLAERGRFREGYLFAKCALDLANKHGYVKARARILYTIAGDLNHWVNHLRTTRAIIDEAFRQCLEQGERDYGGYLLTLARCQNEFFAGHPVAHFKTEVSEIYKHVSSTQNTLGQGLASAAFMALSHLDGTTRNENTFDIGEHQESDLLRSIATHDHELVACFFHLLKGHNYLFLGRYRDAAASLDAARQHKKSLATEMTLPMLTFFSGICFLKTLAGSQISESQRETCLAEVRQYLELLHAWSHGCPQNFSHCYLMLRAELDSFENRREEAAELYERAIQAAHDNAFVQFEGLGFSLYADFLRSQGHPGEADQHLRNARVCYEHWGARRLVENLQVTGRGAIDNGDPSGPMERNLSTANANAELDLQALFDLTLRISGQVDLDGLKTELAQVLLEVTGAQRVIIFLPADNGALEPVVNRDIEGKSESAEAAAYPAALVNIVARTRELSTIQDQVPEPSFDHDPYLTAVRPVAALCLPLLHQSMLAGLVYLENRINRMDFSEHKLQILSVLGAQAAISIRNSLLYSELETKVNERTRELTILTEELESRVAIQVEQINKLQKLRRFLSPHVSDLVLSAGEQHLLKNHRQNIAILFCDLREFTAFTESVAPEDSMETLQAYHHLLGDIIRRYRATVDHLAGDGLMVFLGDPIPSEQPVKDAVDMAVEMRRAVQALIARWDALAPNLGFGIGVSYGYATIGLIGGEERTVYSATGRYVNLASRLCSEAKSGQILVTQEIASEIGVSHTLEFVDDIQFKGFRTPISVFNVVA